jgi:hypothetical protein
MPKNEALSKYLISFAEKQAKNDSEFTSQSSRQQGTIVPKTLTIPMKNCTNWPLKKTMQRVCT